MPQFQVWLPRVLFESFLIVISIVFALALDEWREDQDIQELVNRSVDSFEMEIERNKSTIEYIAPIHAGLQEILVRRRGEDGPQAVAEFRDLMAGFQPPQLFTSAWDTAVATGALSRMDYDVVRALSLTYSTQNRYREIHTTGMNALLTNTGLSRQNFDNAMYSAERFMSDVTAAETELQVFYEQALQFIEETREK